MDADFSDVTSSQITNSIPHLHAAVEHLVKAWDAVCKAEEIFGFEITTMDLSDLAAGIDDAHQVRGALMHDTIREWVDALRKEPK